MGAVIKAGPIAPRDLLLREASLSDYLTRPLEELGLSIAVIQANYNTSFLPLSAWAIAARSLAHQMEARSQLLFMTAQSGSSPMLATKMSYHRATVTCSQLFEVKNED